MIFVARHESILMSAGHSFVVFLVSIGILSYCLPIIYNCLVKSVLLVFLLYRDGVGRY